MKLGTRWGILVAGVAGAAAMAIGPVSAAVVNTTAEPNCPGGPATNDNIFGTQGPDNLCAGNGNDNVFARGGNDSIDGSGGNDSIYGDAGDDVVRGGPGLDKVFGGDGNDDLRGGADADQLYGEAGDDFLDARTGDNAAKDFVFCGPGNDIVQVNPEDYVHSDCETSLP